MLVRSESLYFKLSGIGAAGIMVLPVLIALAAYQEFESRIIVPRV